MLLSGQPEGPAAEPQQWRTGLAGIVALQVTQKGPAAEIKGATGQDLLWCRAMWRLGAVGKGCTLLWAVLVSALPADRGGPRHKTKAGDSQRQFRLCCSRSGWLECAGGPSAWCTHLSVRGLCSNVLSTTISVYSQVWRDNMRTSCRKCRSVHSILQECW